MPTPRRPAGGRRRPRSARARLVGVADLLSTASGFRDHEEEQAFAAGLQAARLLQLHFPAVFDALVRDHPVTPGALYAAIELFINLAEGRLMGVDMSRVEFRQWEPDPVAQFPLSVAEYEAWGWDDAIAHVAMDRDQIWDPMPQIWGLSRNPDETDPREYPLAALVWKLLAKTAMATMREHTPGAIEAMVPAGPIRAAIAAIAPLPEGTDVQRLCEELDRRRPHGVAQLGSSILLVAGMTGNQYADTTMDELLDFYGNYGIDWADTANLAEIRAAQTEAEQIYRAFRSLNDRMIARPRRVATLFRAVHRIAAELRAQQARPRTLAEIFTPTEPMEDPFGNAYHPIDIFRDTEFDERRGVEILGPVYVLSATNPNPFGEPGLPDPAADTADPADGGHPAR